jgi:hypothetical protein
MSRQPQTEKEEKDDEEDHEEEGTDIQRPSSPESDPKKDEGWKFAERYDYEYDAEDLKQYE